MSKRYIGSGSGLSRLFLTAAVAVTWACSDSPSESSSRPALAVTIAGLPAGAAGQVTVTGPSGFSRQLTATATLTDLQPGTYTITAEDVTATGDIYRPSAASQTAQVPARSSAPTAVSVTYALFSGSIDFSFSGLPQGAAPEVHVSGPSGSWVVTQPGTLRGLAPGVYLVGAGDVVVAGQSYGSSAPTQYVTITTGTQASISLAYTLRELNLLIPRVHLSQSVQRADLSIPFVAGRPAYLRVFVQANTENAETPVVRARFYRGGTEVYSAEASGVFGVPTQVNEELWSRSWNVHVPGTVLQPGTSVLVDVDPRNEVGERNESDNIFPTSGAPLALNVLQLQPLQIRLVPIRQPDGSIGGVTDANRDAFLSDLLKMFPIERYEADVRGVYQTGTQASSVENWSSILSELNALRTADGDTRYYYGVLNATTAAGGLAGLAYRPGKAALGWDRVAGERYINAPGVLAHELGHNFGRAHAPCGAVGGPDPQFPHAGGTIGAFGIDVAEAQLYTPEATDLMGYCSNLWISDYTYQGLLDHAAAASTSPRTQPRAGPALLLWGRINERELVLEPAFAVTTRPRMPEQPGRYTLVGADAQGRELFRFSFEPEALDEHAPAPEAHFAFAVPISESARAQLATIRLLGAGREVIRRAGTASADPEPVKFETAGARETRVVWDARTFPVVMLRDVGTGEIVSFARGGRVSVPVARADLHAIASDGVRSVSLRPAALPVR